MKGTTLKVIIEDISRVNKIPTKVLYTMPNATIVNILNNLFGINGNYNLLTRTYKAISSELIEKHAYTQQAIDSIPTKTVVYVFNNLFGIKDKIELTPQELSRVHYPFVKQSSESKEGYTISKELTIDDLLDLLIVIKDSDIEFSNLIKKRLVELTQSKTA